MSKQEAKEGIVIIQAIFHTQEMKKMLAAAKATARELSLRVDRVVSVPGSMEVPFALHKNLSRPEISGAVILGIIERGETDHGITMGQAVINSIISQQVATGKPVGVGIIGPGVKPSQISPRLEGYASAAVKALHHMLNLG